MKLTIVSSTNRPGSNTRKVAGHIQESIRKYLDSNSTVSLLDLLELPRELFVPESYAQKPSSFDRFKNEILQSD